ncbi:hypothetical protein B9Z55_020988 [Caenorhabditis nigoni]|uniref:Peptidase M13 C-terminal domain-containing protein n=1 Tax=Caenorhabditis nigoni TaxID=1611254 RepID=A0A2G5TQ34_9PELO|nr:hypothetical protein B9Z55_020988 [Caenorhabditis nigoni]
MVSEHLHKDLSSSSKSENAIKIFFDKCEATKRMNQTLLALNEKREILKMIKQVGSWPMLSKSWNESEFDLNYMMSNIAKFGVPSFGFFMVKDDPDPEFTVELATTVDTEKLAKDIVEILKENNILFDTKSIQEDVQSIAKLANDIAQLHSAPIKVKALEYGIGRIQESVPSIDFERITKNFFNPKRKDLIWEKLKTKFISPADMHYFSNKTRNIETVLRSTPRRTLANYLIYIFIRNLNLLRVAIGQQENICAELVTEVFPLAALRVYVRNHYDKENLVLASDMVEEIRENLIETFMQSTWLHGNTKMRAIRKAELMKKVIGYPPEFEVPGALDSFFESVTFSETDSYFTTVLKALKLQREQNFDYHSGFLSIAPIKKYLTSGAHYSPWENTLTLRIPLIDDPYFDSTYPKYARIASIGEAIGHEMGHGFDTTGRKRDENGQEHDWWTPEDSAEYDRKAQCLIDQYNNYDDPDFGRNLNGSTTIKEMAADLIGISVSLKTYNKVDFANEPSIFGFEDEKPDKLFFHITALNWCRARDTTPLATKLTAVHPTSSFRVNGVFSNMKSFAQAFNCPVGSPMNPKKKCELF